MKIFIFLVVKFSIYLNRRIFVMYAFLISPQKYIVDTLEKRLDEALLKSTHNICFHGKIRKNVDTSSRAMIILSPG